MVSNTSEVSIVVRIGQRLVQLEKVFNACAPIASALGSVGQALTGQPGTISDADGSTQFNDQSKNGDDGEVAKITHSSSRRSDRGRHRNNRD